MARFLLSRVVQALVSILGVSTIVFVVMHLSGDPTLLLVPEGASREDVALLRRQLGFDRPLAVQYAEYLTGLARLRPRHVARPAGAGRHHRRVPTALHSPPRRRSARRRPRRRTAGRGDRRRLAGDSRREAPDAARAGRTEHAHVLERHPPHPPLRGDVGHPPRVGRRQLELAGHALDRPRRLVDGHVRPHHPDRRRRGARQGLRAGEPGQRRGDGPDRPPARAP